MADSTNDQQRLSAFLSILSDNVMEELEGSVESGRFPDRKVQAILKYSDYIGRVSSHFDDEAMEASFKKFNQAFSAFEDYWGDHVYSEGDDRLMYTVFPKRRDKDEVSAVAKATINKLWQLFRPLKAAYREFVLVARGGIIKVSKTQADKRFIIKNDTTGKFYCGGRLVECNDPKNIYFRIFRILFEHSDAEGFCSYHDIVKYLVKAGVPVTSSDRKNIERISNALKNLFRYTNLPKKLPIGDKLITVRRGKGLVLNNPLR